MSNELSQDILSFSDLGLEPYLVANMVAPNGLILIAGPAGSGKTTLSITMMDEIVSRTRDEIHPPQVLSLANELNSKAAVGACINAVSSGHLVFASLHALGVAETLKRLVHPYSIEERDFVAPRIMGSLQMIISQRLVRTPGGRLTGCREYMVFDEATRRNFIKAGHANWASLSEEMLRSKQGVSMTFSESAQRLSASSHLECRISSDLDLDGSAPEGPINGLA